MAKRSDHGINEGDCMHTLIQIIGKNLTFAAFCIDNKILKNEKDSLK